MEDDVDSIEKSAQVKESKSKDESVEKLRKEVTDLKEKLNQVQEEQKVTQAMQNNMKSEGTTLALAILFGLIGLSGIGHMYVKKIGKGVAILIISIIIFWMLGIPLSTQDRRFVDLPILYVFGNWFLLGYAIMYISQIIDAHRSCQRYNLEIYKSHSTKYV